MAVYNVLGTSEGTTKEAVIRSILGLFAGPLAPDQGWIEDCIESYAKHDGSRNLILRTEDALKTRTQEHNQMVAALVQLGHEFGFRVWISRDQQRAEWSGKPLAALLADTERNFGPESLLGGLNSPQIDVVWYGQGKLTYVFQVEWTTVFGDALLAADHSTPSVRRFLVVPEERVSLISAKLARYPWMSRAIGETGWEFVKYQHLMASMANEQERNLFGFGKIVGLRPPIEQSTAQLKLL
ncbi:MAG: hypothetical protein M1358_10580 [Chloroflexi bacterium]|nr:hypothetical protein [Chloroflexota bacterium]